MVVADDAGDLPGAIRVLPEVDELADAPTCAVTLPHRLELRTRRGLVLSPQRFGPDAAKLNLHRVVNSPEYGVSRRGDFEPLVSDETFYRAQAVLTGRLQVAGPRQRNIRPTVGGLTVTGSAARQTHDHTLSSGNARTPSHARRRQNSMDTTTRHGRPVAV